MTESILKVSGLSHAYGAAPVLDDVSLALAPGEVVAVVGPSGAGKTTLFRCITQLTRPSTGRVLLDGVDLTAVGGRRLAAVRCGLGLIFQQYNLVRRISAADNVLAGRLAHIPVWRVLIRCPGQDERRLALACLERVGLAAHADSRADQLSGGQQQRVAIARALAQHSRVMLADEPVASLDPAAAASVLGTLKGIARQDGIAVLCSLHQVEMVAGFADRVLGLREGKIVLDVPAEQFTGDHQGLAYRGDAVASTTHGDGG